MKRFEREAFLAARRIVEQAGGTCRYERGTGRHARLEIELNGQRRITPLSMSPGRPSRALHYKLGDVRRILKEIAASA